MHEEFDLPETRFLFRLQHVGCAEYADTKFVHAH